ncbi:MAG: TlpA family protein disulfide reductase [bacterium]|nr:TlpA family protein disulfide reductase [bacterium]
MNDYSDNNMTEATPQVPKSFWNSSNFYVLVFGSVMLVGLLALAWIGRPPRSMMIGQTLPQLDLQPLLNAEEPVTNAALQGKLSVIHFWGTWCPPCQREFPEFAKLAAEFEQDSNVEIISVSCSGGPEMDLQKLMRETQEFLTDYPNPIPTYSDSTAMTRQQLAMLSPSGSFGYPTTLLVNREGTIVEALEGYRPGEMEKLMARIQSEL